INLVLDDRTATATGQLDVPKADITVNSVPETAVRPSGDVTVHGERTADETTQRSIRVNVVVGLGDAVQLNAFGLSTGVEGRVRIRGGSREPYTGNGSLSLKDGRYKAYGQDLEIESGELVFNGRLDNPQLDVRAVRRIEAEDVVAGIRLSGTPRQLRSEVYSDPSMRDAEVLSYLLTGRSISSRDAEDDDLLNSAAFALGLSQAGSITSQIRGDLGLDTLSVEGGSESGRIVAGKRFGDRLLVEYGYGIIDQLGTLLLRYQLNNRLVLESRTGTVSELDLVYSVKKK
ncbi:MAG: translocation/assembly module TamB domain-containing protein, partial [Woeseiaceae bacterium]|nr:translocation/assembly module TamB domain-containing protein [Woeseiaceae bacterium]